MTIDPPLGPAHTLTATFVCDLCKRKAVIEQPFGLGSHIYHTAVPAFGWNWIAGKLICPKHRILADPGTDHEVVLAEGKTEENPHA